MNLWVKRTGQLVSIAVALFFLSCQDDVSELGYRNPNSKFNVKYIEIPLESSVFLTDSVRTAVLNGEVSRILVGKYTDPSIGVVETTGYTQIFPTRFGEKDSVSFFEFDSAAIELRCDFYSYGLPGKTKESFIIHEVESKLEPTDAAKYYSTTETAYNPDYVAYNSIDVDATEFKKKFDMTTPDDTVVAHISIKDPLYRQRLWDYATLRLTESDSLYYANFLEAIPGLAILPNALNKKIVGFNINNTLSRVVLYYHKKDKTAVRTFSFGFFGVEYTNVKTTFAGELLTLDSVYKEIKPATNRYIQQDTRVITKVDLNNFYAFADTVDRMIINSCELAITEVSSDEGNYYHVPSIGFVAMSDYLKNQYYKVHYDYPPIQHPVTGDTLGYNKVVTDSLKPFIQSYEGFINDINGVFSAMSDSKSDPIILQWTGTSYNTYMTLMAQHLSLRPATDRHRYFALFPSTPANPQREKSVNRTIFNKENLVLKIYYTTPKEPAQ